MEQITLLFTRRRWNPVSWLIRWAVPRSRFALSLSSHCLIDAGDFVYEANMLHGVRCALKSDALAGLTIVKSVTYSVPSRGRAMDWLDAQIGKSYDWHGAFGLGLAPYRNWSNPSKWFCYELGAGALRAAGRPVFANLSHVGETALLAIEP